MNTKQHNLNTNERFSAASLLLGYPGQDSRTHSGFAAGPGIGNPQPSDGRCDLPVTGLAAKGKWEFGFFADQPGITPLA